MKKILVLFFTFFSFLIANVSCKAAEKINIKFEEMEIPINIDQLSRLEKSDSNSTELIAWFKENGFLKVFELPKFLNFPVFKEGGLNKKVLRSWVGRKILSELSKTIIIPNDNDGIEVFNTIEKLLEDKIEISTLDIIKALPSQEITLDVDNLILIISSWKKELAEQQNLLIKLKAIKKTSPKFFTTYNENFFSEITKEKKKVYSPHRVIPLEIELWKSKKASSNKELIIFMPGLGGDIENFKWIGEELTRRGWPIVFLDHTGSNSETFKKVIEGNEVIPGSADFFLYRIKDLDAVLGAHRNGKFGLENDSYILMGHSLGALIAVLYESEKIPDGLKNRCDNSLNDFALTNLSKLLQCQLSEIALPEKNNKKKARAIIGFNTFGSLVWPKEKSSGIDMPILLIGGTFDLITPLINEQFKVFLSANNKFNRFLIVEGASHFFPIRIEDGIKGNNSVFKINETFIGSDPLSVQDLSLKTIIEFLDKINKKEGIILTANQRESEINFHILDRKTISDISRN